jgi:hypothetical protein
VQLPCSSHEQLQRRPTRGLGSKCGPPCGPSDTPAAQSRAAAAPDQRDVRAASGRCDRGQQHRDGEADTSGHGARQQRGLRATAVSQDAFRQHGPAAAASSRVWSRRRGVRAAVACGGSMLTAWPRCSSRGGYHTHRQRGVPARRPRSSRQRRHTPPLRGGRPAQCMPTARPLRPRHYQAVDAGRRRSPVSIH